MEERIIKDINNLLTQLFQKMHEAGYEWDAEKKELKKIHVIDEGKAEMDYCFTKMMNDKKVSSAWSEEDEETFSHLEDVVDFCYRNQYVVDVQTCERVRQLVSRLKSLCFQSKWSKDDITRIDEIIETLNIVQANRVRTQRMHYNKATIDKNINWLKSLKDRYTWKPSDEQIMALRFVLNHIPYDSHKEEISGLLEQLKKLREE